MTAVAPPLAAGLPLVGSVLDLARDTRGFLTEQYRRLGPVFRVSVPGRELTVLAGVEANLFMQGEGRKHLRSREQWQDFDAEFGAARSLLSMDGPDHTRYRKAQRNGYARKQIEQHLGQAVVITRREMQRWPLGETVAGHYALQRIITEQLGILAAGTSPGAYLDDMILFVRTLLLVRVIRQRPALLLQTPAFRRARRRVELLYEEVLANHRAADHVGRDADLVDDVLDLHHVDPAFLPDRDLMIAVLGPFTAGLDTVASTCAFMLHALLRDGELMTAVTRESDRFFEAGATPAALRDLDVTRRTMLETMRMYPIAPALPRWVAEPFEFAGYPIAADTPVLMATTVPHHLEEYFPDPDRFDIDRYTDDRQEHRAPGVYAPFGRGPHTCLGSAFAEAQIMVTMATMVREAELWLDPPEYELRIDPAPTPSPDRHFGFQVGRIRRAG